MEVSYRNREGGSGDVLYVVTVVSLPTRSNSTKSVRTVRQGALPFRFCVLSCLSLVACQDRGRLRQEHYLSDG